MFHTRYYLILQLNDMIQKHETQSYNNNNVNEIYLSRELTLNRFKIKVKDN